MENTNTKKPVNHTMVLLNMLSEKYNIKLEKLVQYCKDNGNRKSSFKLFLSGLMYELSVNENAIIQKLS